MTPFISSAMAALRSIRVTQIATCALLCVTFVTLASSILHADEKFKAVTTFTVIADMARNVAGDAAVVSRSPNQDLKFTAIHRPQGTYCARKMLIWFSGTE